jgi:hypothetical protein
MRPPPSPSPIPSDAILLSEMSRLLGVAPCSCWRWAVRDGLLTAWRIGGRWRVSRADALALVKTNRPRPEVQAQADRQAELLEVDRELREGGVRR